MPANEKGRLTKTEGNEKKTSERGSECQISPLEETATKRKMLACRLEEKLKNTPLMRPHHRCVSLLPESEFDEITEQRTEENG